MSELRVFDVLNGSETVSDVVVTFVNVFAFEKYGMLLTIVVVEVESLLKVKVLVVLLYVSGNTVSDRGRETSSRWGVNCCRLL
jgi:hypothetical protein